MRPALPDRTHAAGIKNFSPYIGSDLRRMNLPLHALARDCVITVSKAPHTQAAALDMEMYYVVAAFPICRARA